MACYLTNVDFSLVGFSGIRPRAISQQVHKLLFCVMSVKELDIVI